MNYQTVNEKLNMTQTIRILKRNLVFFILIMVLLMGIGRLIHAQETNISFYSLDINFWPEYDNQYMLVKYKGILNPSTTLPAKIQFKIPFNSTLMNYISVENLSGQKIYLPFEVFQDGKDQIVEFMVDTLQFELSFHDESLSKIVNQRFYNANLEIGYNVSDLNLIIQVPELAEEMQIEPSPSGEFVGLYNLNYYVVDIGTIAHSDFIMLNINYFKENNDLTFGFVEPILPGYNQKFQFNDLIVPALISFTILLIVILLIYLLNVERFEQLTIRRNLKKPKEQNKK